MGRHLFRALVANGFVRLPEPTASAKPAPRRRMLLERLEDRLLFDAGPVAPVDADAELAQQAAAVQEAMPLESSLAEPAEVRLIAPLENVAEVVADLTNSATNHEPELIPDADSSGSATVDGTTTAALASDPSAALLDIGELEGQLLTTADELRSEVRAATSDVRDELLSADEPVLNGEAVTRREIAFVETSLVGHEQLVHDLLAQRDPSREIQVVFIDGRENGLAKITETLRSESDIDAIHVFSHGDSRGFKLGSQWVTSDLLAGYSAELSAWGDALLDGADILIYGCDLASETAGRELLQSLAALTGADVAASDDLTGSASRGGDWDLEFRIGEVTTESALNDGGSFEGTLVTANVGDGAIVGSLNRSLYSIDVATGKATLITTAPATVGGVSLGSTINSVAVNTVDGLIYYADNASSSSNVALFAYDYVNDTHILIDSDLTDNGIAVGSRGVGSGAAHFVNSNQTLYFGVERVTSNTNVLFAITFTAGSNGRTVSGSSSLLTYDVSGGTFPSHDWGDITVDPIADRLYDFDGGGGMIRIIRLSDGTVLSANSNGGLSSTQQGTDLNGNRYLLTNALRAYDSTNNTLGSPLTVTTDGSTAWGSAADASGPVPATGQIGDLIFDDDNGDGVFNGTDTGLNNVTVDLYDDVDADGTVDVGVDRLLATATTNASGAYSFDGLLPGDYLIQVTDTNSVLGSAPSTTGGASRTTLLTTIGDTDLSIDFGYAVNAPPTIDLDANDSSGTLGNNYSTSYTENGGGVTIADVDVTITDLDSTNITSATIVLTNAQAGDALTVGSLPGGISSSVSSGNGQIAVTLTGSTSLAGYQTAISGITFSNSTEAPNTTARTINVTVNDGAADSNTATTTITVVAVNDAPTGVDQTVTTAEDTDYTFATSDFPFSDVDGDSLARVRIDTLPADGTVLLSGVAVAAGQIVSAADVASGNLTFRPDLNENGSPYTAFLFSVGDASTFVALPSTMTVDVTPTSVSVAKSLFDSSDPLTLGSNVTIGEELCFALLVTMSEGNSTDLILTDLLPDGLLYNSFTLITDAASSNGLLAADFNGSVPVPSVSGGTFDGEDVAFTFGAITVATDGNAANNAFVLLVHVFVSDIPSNHDPLVATPVLTNNVTADVSNPQPPVNSNPFDVTVIEPDLSVTIDNGVATLTAGQSTTYSITVSNDGDSVATGIVLTGSLPIDRVSFVSTDDAANFSIDGSGNFTWTPAVASLAPSGSLTLLLNVQVSSTLDAGITDVTIPVNVTHDNIEPTPVNNSAADTDSLDAVPDLRVTKTDFTGSISPGQGSVYTINISNVGTQAATNVLVTETVPTGTTFNAALSDPLWTLVMPDTYQISLPTLAAGAGFNVNFTVSINSPATAGQDDIVNTVSISDDGANGSDPNPGDNSAIDTNTLDAVPDYQITISDGEASVVPGQSLNYSINFTNTGLQNGSGVIVTDTFPPEILENVIASDGGLVDAFAGTITWNVGDLAVGDSRTFTVTAKVRDTVPANFDNFTHNTTITDDVSNGLDPTPGNNAGADTDTLDARPDYHIAITDGETAVAPGQSLSYTVSFLNAGNQGGTGVVVSDTFPIAILENVVASDGGIVDAVAGTITWNVGNLAAGESRSFTVTAKVRDTIPASFDDFTHSTTIADDSTNGVDLTPADNSATDTDTLDAQPDYQIGIDDAVPSATTGQSLTYSVTFANAGFQDGTGVVISNSFPLSVLTNVVASNGGVVDMTSGTIVWNVGNLAAGASLTYTVTADVLSSVAAGIDDFAHSTSITDNAANGSDPTPANNSASDTDTLNAAPDLRITKTDYTNSISPGQCSSYTINVGNFGTQGATNVVVTETVPIGGTFNAALSDPAWTNVGGNVYQSSILSLPAGASFNVNFSVLIDNPAAAGQDDLVNTASIADDGTNGPDLDPNNNTATDTNTLDAVPNYDIGIDDLQASATVGESLTYYVNFNNSGLQNGSGVVITATFPTAILTNVAASDGGVVDAVAGTITWNVGALTANAPRTFEITADIRAVVPAGFDDFTLTASITDDGANGIDPDLSDNNSSDTDTLDAQPDYLITIDDGETLLRPGDSVTYTVAISNQGNQDGAGVVVATEFPTALLQDIVASSGGVVDTVAGTITWAVGDLPVGDNASFHFTAKVRQVLDPNTPSVTVTATVTDDGGNGADPTPGNNVGSDVDRLQVYAYDSFHDWKEMRNAGLMPQTQSVGRPLAPLPVDPVFSGLTEPGSTLIARIYNADGHSLGDRQVVADSAGNWLVSFPNIIIYEYPHRMEIVVTPAINNLTHENGFNLRRYFHPAIHAGLVMTEPLSVAGVFRNRAYNIVEAQHAANTHPLGFQWYSHAYELNAASSNVSQM